jgi:hypothetical protein
MINKTILTGEELAKRELESLISELETANSFSCIFQETIVEQENIMVVRVKSLVPDARSYYEYV